MKWKRSKKAQQEAKSLTKDSSGSDTTISNNKQAVVTSSKPTAAISQDTISENQAESDRKIQDGESLYRPYVV